MSSEQKQLEELRALVASLSLVQRAAVGLCVERVKRSLEGIRPEVVSLAIAILGAELAADQAATDGCPPAVEQPTKEAA